MSASEPQQFGKYLLLDRIAAGGMAEIYRAQLNAVAGVTKPVVIKKILPHYAGNKNFVSMFINEANIALGLSHGNIAQIFDFGEVDGEYFLAMELVHGQALSRVLRRARQRGVGTLPVPYALYICMELCKGLHYAHTRVDDKGHPLNIVHRDVSPQNVIISYDGHVKIVDFGIAKARVATQTETQAGAVKGKYTYFAPEQARGKPLDGQTDVFAAGIVLYEMVCGRLPFEGKMVEVLSRIVRGEFPRPRTLNSDLPREVERIILTALATEKETRYATAELFQEALAVSLYASVPTFASNTLSQLMGYLFEEELTAEGRRPQLPPDFVEQLASLKVMGAEKEDLTSYDRPRISLRPTRKSDATSSRPRSSPESSNEARARRSGEARAGDKHDQSDGPQTEHLSAPVVRNALQSSLGRVAPRWVFLGVPLLATLLAAGVVLLVGHYSTFAVQLTSSPPGASVTVDGRLSPMVTPLLISDLGSDRPHTLEVSAPNRRPWIKELAPERGRTLSVHAVLDPLPVPKPAAPPTAAGVSQDETLIDDAKGLGSYLLSTVRHAVSIPGTTSARFRLDPRKTYKVWTEGKVTLATGATPVTECAAYLTVPSAADSLLVIGRKPVSIHGAATFYAFIPDERTGDNSGNLSVRIQEKGAREAFTLLLDGKRNAVALPRDARLRVSELDPNGRYELLLRPGNPEPSNPRSVRILSFQSGPVPPGKEPVSQLRVLSLGGRYELSGAVSVTFFLPDDVVQGNSGNVEIRVMRMTSRADSTSNIRILPSSP